MSKYCNKCGAGLEDKDTFCRKCGKKQSVINESENSGSLNKKIVNYKLLIIILCLVFVPLLIFSLINHSNDNSSLEETTESPTEYIKEIDAATTENYGKTNEPIDVNDFKKELNNAIYNYLASIDSEKTYENWAVVNFELIDTMNEDLNDSAFTQMITCQFGPDSNFGLIGWAKNGKVLQFSTFFVAEIAFSSTEEEMAVLTSLMIPVAIVKNDCNEFSQIHEFTGKIISNGEKSDDDLSVKFISDNIEYSISLSDKSILCVISYEEFGNQEIGEVQDSELTEYQTTVLKQNTEYNELLLDGVWVDLSTCRESSYDPMFSYCCFKDKKMFFGDYCGWTGQEGEIEKIEIVSEAKYNLSVHYPLVDNEAFYYEERNEVFTIELSDANIKFLDGAPLYDGSNVFVYSGKTFEEAVDTINHYLQFNNDSEHKNKSYDEIDYYTGILTYDNRINEYRTAISIGRDAFYTNYPDDSIINTLMVRYYYDYNIPLYYALFDINNDGSYELLFSNGECIIDIYSLSGNKLIKIFKDCYFGERTWLYLLSDGSLLSTGSGSAFGGSFERYKFNANGNGLDCIEKCYYDTNGEDPYMSDYLYMSVDEYNERYSTFDCSIMDEIVWFKIESF